MFGEIKDLASLKVRALELAVGIGMMPPQSGYVIPDAKEVVERAKIYEEYLKEGVNIPTNQWQDNSLTTLSIMPLIWNMKSEGREFTSEWRAFFEKVGIDPSLLDAICGKSTDSGEKKVDDILDKVNESREIHFDDYIVVEWLHPELRNHKHRYELRTNDIIVASGNDFIKVLFEFPIR